MVQKETACLNWHANPEVISEFYSSWAGISLSSFYTQGKSLTEVNNSLPQNTSTKNTFKAGSDHTLPKDKSEAIGKPIFNSYCSDVLSKQLFR